MHTTSASLLERVSGGTDTTAWDRFVCLYTPLLLNWCRRLGLDDADAADFAQDVFIILLQHLPQFRYDPNRSFRAWLKTILMNVWRKHQRKASRAPVGGGDPDLVPDTDPACFIDEAEHNEHLVRRAMAIAETDFEPTTWQLCWEFLVQGRPASELAAQFGVSENAVYLAKSRVLRHLRVELAGLMQ